MNISQKFNALAWNVKYKAQEAGKFVSKKVQRIAKEENGDTNFISIAIILAIVLVVAGIFIVFKNQILGMFNDSTNEFFSAVDNQSNYTTSH